MKRAAISNEFKKAFQVFYEPGTETTKIADDLYSFRWLSYRTAFLVTAEGVILFDPTNEDAARGLLEAIEKVAPGKQVRYVIYSHHHRDHVSGGRVIPGNPIVVAHANTARDIRERAYLDVVPPTEVFTEDEHLISLGGKTVRLVRAGGGHSDGMIAAVIPHRRAVYVPDLAQLKRLPPLGAPGSGFHGTLASLKILQAIDYDTFIPGHGALGTKAGVDEYVRFLHDMDAALKASLARRALTDLHARETYARAEKELAPVFFDVEDALRPKYGKWVGFDSMILLATQWCFAGHLAGD